MVRFVPNAVMAGFINAVAINIILGQLDNFTGFTSTGANRILRAIDTATNPASFLPTLMVGIVTIFLILTLENTRLGALGMVVAIIVASLLVPLAGWDMVQQVSDIADVPGSLPRPAAASVGLPAAYFARNVAGLCGAGAGAGISKSHANPDGKYPDVSGDFMGQGVANIFAGVFQGMPVGGSMSATSLLINAGARSRFANITAGLIMAVVILVFGSAVGYIALPAIAGLLIVIGFRTLKPSQVSGSGRPACRARGHGHHLHLLSADSPAVRGADWRGAGPDSLCAEAIEQGHRQAVRRATRRDAHRAGAARICLPKRSPC